MADPIGAVGLGLHAAHLLIVYLGEVQDGPKNRQEFKFELNRTSQYLDYIKGAYDQAPYEVKERCAPQYEQVFGRNGTFRFYLRLLISLNRSLQKKGFTKDIRDLIRRGQEKDAAAIDIEDKADVQLLLESISEGLKEKGQISKWIFPFQKDEIEADIERILKYSDTFDRLRIAISENVNLEALSIAKATQANLRNARTVADRIEAAQRSMAGQLDTNRIQSLLDWLSSVDPWSTVESQLQECKASEPKWILDRPEYQKWLSAQSDRELWCVGEMGVGKTTLAAFIADQLLVRKSMGKSSLCVATFFFKFKSDYQESLDVVMRCLARQLIGDDWNVNPGRRDRVALVDFLKRRPPGISPLQLAEYLLDGYDTAFIILDAMDECGVQGELLDGLRTLYKSCPGLRVFITSRPMKEIGSDIRQITITADDELIRRCIKARLEEWIRSWGGSGSAIATICKKERSPDSVVEFVVDSAQGKFLFAVLQWESLKKAISRSYILQRLDSPVRYLDKESFGVLFEEAIDRIKTQRNHVYQLVGKQALMWVIHAKRILTSGELLQALSMDPDIPDVDGSEAAATMVDCTQGLLTLEGPDRLVQIHKGFQDYCDSNPEERQKYFPNANANIACACLEYLSLQKFSGTHLRTDTEWGHRTRDNPLYSYAAIRWGNHIKDSGEERFLGDDTPFPLMDFLQDDTKAAVTAQAILWDLSRSWRSFFRPDDLVRWRSPPGDEPLLPALHIAIYFGLLQTAARLLQSGINVDKRAPYGFTALHFACRLQNHDEVKFLLSHGADPAYENRDQQYCIHTAAIGGAHRIVQLILDSKPSLINQQNWFGRTPLVDAIESSRDDVTRYLLQQGADPHISDRDGNDALLKAAKRNRFTVLPEIVEAMKPAIGEMSRALAMAVEAHSNRAVQYLIDLGADPGHTNWDHIWRTAFHFGAEANNPEALEIILKKWKGGHLPGYGPIIDLISSRNRSPLTIASEHGFVEVVEVLLKYGAIPSANREWEGRTPLHWAAQFGHANLIDKLLTANKDLLDLKMHGMRTAISLAAEYGKPHCVEKLIEYGADPTIPGAHGNTPLHWSVINDRRRVAGLLTERCLSRWPQLLNQRNNKGESALWLAARAENDDRKDIGMILLNSGADPYSEDNETMTTLHAATMGESVQLMKAIVEKAGDSILEKRIKNWHETALYMAVSHKREASVRTLIELGADTKARSRQKRTPLLMACDRDNAEILRVLLEKDGDLMGCRDIEGCTGLHIKARTGDVHTLQMVLDRCDDTILKEQDGLGRTAIHHAAIGRGAEELNMVLDKYAKHHLLQDVLFWQRKDGLKPSEAAIALARPRLANILEEREVIYRKTMEKDGSTENSSA